MQSASHTAPVSKKLLWAGRIMSALVVLFLLFDSIIKVMKLPPAVEGTARLGYPESLVFGIGIVELICILVYVIPRTSVLGAILLTGYLGGATATNLRVGNPLFSHVLFPIYVGVLVWGGLFLRNNRSIPAADSALSASRPAVPAGSSAQGAHDARPRWRECALRARMRAPHETRKLDLWIGLRMHLFGGTKQGGVTFQGAYGLSPVDVDTVEARCYTRRRFGDLERLWRYRRARAR